MRKKTSRTSGASETKKEVAGRKLSDLQVKAVKGGDAESVKGGCGTGMSKNMGQV